MKLPLKGCYVTSPYGIKRSNGKVHTGIDIISKCGDKEVRAIKGGEYCGRYWDKNGYGNYVVVQHDDGIKALYCHLNSVEPIAIGKRIEEGQLLGIEGTTGNSTGIHLHLEIRENPYTPKFHKNIAEYLNIENKNGYVKMKKTEGNIMLDELIKEYGEPQVRKALVRLIKTENDDGLPAQWAENELKEAKELGITDGSNPETFTTRQEVAIMVLRAIKNK